MPENNSAPIIEVNNLSVSFGQRQVVCQAGFHLNAGETFSLIGESGCGKSTILRVIAGLQREWLGGVQLLSQHIHRSALSGALRRNVQMVFQDPYASLHPFHTIHGHFQNRYAFTAKMTSATEWQRPLYLSGCRRMWHSVIRISSPAGSASALLLPVP